jgi:hypothetical protein
MRNVASVKEPTILPSTRATKSVEESDDTIFCNSLDVGGGLEDESCGINNSNAEMSSGVTSVARSTTTDIDPTLPQDEQNPHLTKGKLGNFLSKKGGRFQR